MQKYAMRGVGDGVKLVGEDVDQTRRSDVGTSDVAVCSEQDILSG